MTGDILMAVSTTTCCPSKMSYGNDTVMNVPQLVEDYEEGTDGYCLLVERRPSLTPLSVSFGGKISNLEDWEF